MNLSSMSSENKKGERVNIEQQIDPFAFIAIPRIEICSLVGGIWCCIIIFCCMIGGEVKLCRFIMPKIIKENAREVVGGGGCSSAGGNGGILGLSVFALGARWMWSDRVWRWWEWSSRISPLENRRRASWAQFWVHVTKAEVRSLFFKGSHVLYVMSPSTIDPSGKLGWYISYSCALAASLPRRKQLPLYCCRGLAIKLDCFSRGCLGRRLFGW